MSSDVIQAKYDELETIARQFGQRAQAIGELRSLFQRSAQPLEQGGWQGRGSAAFFRELNGQIFPAMQRLRQALEEARAVTLQASAILRRAEQEAAAPFRGSAEAGANGASAGAAFAGASASAAGGAESGGFWGGVGDFFGGMWDEAKDMVGGLKHLVLHPIDTAKGLAHAIMNPGEFWEGFKKPYVEAWESGHPWQAVGRGTMFALSFALGAKGADKAAKAGSMAGKAGRAGEVAATAGRAGEAAGAVGKGARALDTAGDVARGLDTAADAGSTFRKVGTGGKRGELPLTAAQKAEIVEYARQLAPGLDNELIRFVDHLELNTAYGATFDMLNIGTDVMPAANVAPGTLAANSRVSWRGTLAHELVGHRDAALAGRTQMVDVLEEAQASIRAARFAPELSNVERITLLRDAIARLHNAGIRIRDVKDLLYIQQR